MTGLVAGHLSLSTIAFDPAKMDRIKRKSQKIWRGNAIRMMLITHGHYFYHTILFFCCPSFLGETYLADGGGSDRFVLLAYIALGDF